MQAKSQNSTQQSDFQAHVNHAMREGIMWSLFCLSGYLLLSLYTYHPNDPGFSYLGPTHEVVNSGGPVGAWFSDVFFNLFGVFAYLFPIMLSWSALLVFKRRNPDDTVNINLVLILGRTDVGDGILDRGGQRILPLEQRRHCIR